MKVLFFSPNLCYMTVNVGNFFDRDQSLPVKYYNVCLVYHLATVNVAGEDKKNRQDG